MTPERSFWPRARRSTGFWFGGIALVVGLPLLVGGGALVLADWRFAQEARATRGTVLAKEIRAGSHRRRSKTEHYHVAYRFEAEGKTYEGRDELPRRKWELLTERGPVEVLYRPSDPSSNHLVGRSVWLRNSLLAGVGTLFTLLGTVMFAGAVRAARLEWRLGQKGVRAPGTVVELRERALEIDGIRQWRLGYEYRDFQGTSHVGTVDVSADEAGRWSVGDAGTVLYDPGRPGEAVWLGREEPSR
jgi:uncharacterized protein DUF3592